MKKDDAYWEKKFKESGYAQLIEVPDDDKHLPCLTDDCIRGRKRFKTGRYDPYCKECRSIINRYYRNKKKCEKSIQQGNTKT